MNLVNIPMATSAAFRKIAAAKSKAKPTKPSGDKADHGLVEKLCAVASAKNGQPFEVKPSDVIAEESNLFEDTVKSLDCEESRPKTVLDDVLTCLETAHNIVMRVYDSQGLSITDNAATASYLQYECTKLLLS